MSNLKNGSIVPKDFIQNSTQSGTSAQSDTSKFGIGSSLITPLNEMPGTGGACACAGGCSCIGSCGTPGGNGTGTGCGASTVKKVR